MSDQGDFYKEILDNLYDGVYFVDRERRITFWNKGAERITGYRAEDVLGSSCADSILVHVDGEGHQLCNGMCPVAFCLQDGQVRETQVYLHHIDGQRIPVIVRVTPLRAPDGTIAGAVETFSDNTSALTAAQAAGELRQALLLDPLTDLGNRRYIEARLESCLLESSRSGLSCGVLFVDIDHFKAINDSYGHERGDQVLRMVANTMRHAIGATDALGRWGGDEFVVVSPGIAEAQLRGLAWKLRLLVAASQLFTPQGEIAVTVSVGATLCHAGDTWPDLLKRADEAMYASKAAGRDRVSFST